MMSRTKSFIRQLFYRSGLVRGAVGLGSVALGRTKRMDMNHLLSYRENDAVGPLQRDEAIALFGMVRTMRPRVLVEFGFFHGHSAFNFLQAMTADARLFSYDIDAESARRARQEFSHDPRFHFIEKSQTEFAPADLEGAMADFVFFDAAHELELNMETFRKLAPCLADEALVAVHDTGLWHRDHFAPIHHEFAEHMPGEWVTPDLYAHQPGERRFIDWILASHPEFGAIHFHTSGTLRHGFTLLQRQRRLA